MADALELVGEELCKRLVVGNLRLLQHPAQGGGSIRRIPAGLGRAALGGNGLEGFQAVGQQAQMVSLEHRQQGRIQSGYLLGVQGSELGIHGPRLKGTMAAPMGATVQG